MINKLLDVIDAAGDFIVNSIDIYSFQACLLVGLVALVLYIFGYDKGISIRSIKTRIETN